MMKKSRRKFIKKTAGSAAAIADGGVLPAFSAKSYSRIIGANETLLVSVMGVNSRGKALAKNFARQELRGSPHIVMWTASDHACKDAIKDRQSGTQRATLTFVNLWKKDIDALVIAAPDHWHARHLYLAHYRQINMYMWRNHAAIIPMKVSYWCRQLKNMEKLCKWATSAGHGQM
jgi:hypothetical protein